MQPVSEVRNNIAWAKSTFVPTAIVFAMLVAFTVIMAWTSQNALETRESVDDSIALYEYMMSGMFAFLSGGASIITLLFFIGFATYYWFNQRKLRAFTSK